LNKAPRAWQRAMNNLKEERGGKGVLLLGKKKGANFSPLITNTKGSLHKEKGKGRKKKNPPFATSKGEAPRVEAGLPSLWKANGPFFQSERGREKKKSGPVAHYWKKKKKEDPAIFQKERNKETVGGKGRRKGKKNLLGQIPGKMTHRCPRRASQYKRKILVNGRGGGEKKGKMLPSPHPNVGQLPHEKREGKRKEDLFDVGKKV